MRKFIAIGDVHADFDTMWGGGGGPPGARGPAAPPPPPPAPRGRGPRGAPAAGAGRCVWWASTVWISQPISP